MNETFASTSHQSPTIVPSYVASSLSHSACLPIERPLLLEGTGLGLQAVQRLARHLGAQLLGEVQELCSPPGPAQSPLVAPPWG